MVEHEELLNDWASRSRHRGRNFIRDGIVDPEQWERVERKMHFLLKEAYDTEEGEVPDLRVRIRDWIESDDRSSKTWTSMGRWACLAQHVTEDGVRWVDDLANPNWLEALRGCSVSNVKKSDGQSSSKQKNLEEYVREDHELIVGQIEAIEPDIVICGATYSLIAKKLGNTRCACGLKCSGECFYGLYKSDIMGETLFIDFWHPSNRSHVFMKETALTVILQRALFPTESRSVWRHDLV